jgi:hypothetical protein
LLPPLLLPASPLSEAANSTTCAAVKDGGGGALQVAVVKLGMERGRRLPGRASVGRVPLWRADLAIGVTFRLDLEGDGGRWNFGRRGEARRCVASYGGRQ